METDQWMSNWQDAFVTDLATDCIHVDIDMSIATATQVDTRHLIGVNLHIDNSDVQVE